jgi:hypothetical protein
MHRAKADELVSGLCPLSLVDLPGPLLASILEHLDADELARASGARVDVRMRPWANLLQCLIAWNTVRMHVAAAALARSSDMGRPGA